MKDHSVMVAVEGMKPGTKLWVAVLAGNTAMRRTVLMGDHQSDTFMLPYDGGDRLAVECRHPDYCIWTHYAPLPASELGPTLHLELRVEQVPCLPPSPSTEQLAKLRAAGLTDKALYALRDLLDIEQPVSAEEEAICLLTQDMGPALAALPPE